MSIISSLKQEKKRSQSTRPRSNPRKINQGEFAQQNSSIINQTTDQFLLISQQEASNNISNFTHEQPNRKIVMSSKGQKRPFQNVNSLSNYLTNLSNQNQQQLDLQNYFSQQPQNNQNDLPLPFFPNNQEMYSNIDNFNDNEDKQFNNYLNQNQIASALETPKFNFNPFINNERNYSNESDFDINEQSNIDLINIQEESPHQISLKDKLVNSRRNEFFSFGKQRSSIQVQQNSQKLQEGNIQKRKNLDDDLLENEDFSNIKINNSNFIHQNSFHLRNQASFQKNPTSQFVLADISLNQNNTNDQLQIQDYLMKATNYKASKSAIPFKLKNLPKSINNQAKIQIANQLKLSSSPINGYTFYNYIDKENCSVTLPKSDSLQTRNQPKTPIQANHSIQLNQSSSNKIPKQQLLLPPTPLIQQNSLQKNSGSIHIRAIQSQKQGRNNQKQFLNDSLNSINPNKLSRKMIQNQSFDNIQQTLVIENININNNNHKRSQESKNNNLNYHNLANHNNSFDVNRLVLDSIICKENTLKLPNKQILPSQINKLQNQFSNKKQVKAGSSQSFHQRMKTIM